MNSETQPFKSLNISVLIISDTRTVSSDKSGKILEDRIKESGHILISKLFVKDEPTLIKGEISKILKKKKYACYHLFRWYRVDWKGFYTRSFKRNYYKRNTWIW